MVRLCDRNEKGQLPPCHLPSYVMQICMPCCSLHARAGCRQVLLDFLPVLAALSAKPNGCTACCSSNQAVEFCYAGRCASPTNAQQASGKLMSFAATAAWHYQK